MEPETLEFICGHRDNPCHRKNELANNFQSWACLSLADPSLPPAPNLNSVLYWEIHLQFQGFSPHSIVFWILRFKVLVWQRLGLLSKSPKIWRQDLSSSWTAFACRKIHICICIFASLCFLESIFHTCWALVRKYKLLALKSAMYANVKMW